MNETKEMKRWFTATMAMQGMLSSNCFIGDVGATIRDAVLLADALLEELAKEQHEPT